jgi:hypothetical protein
MKIIIGLVKADRTQERNESMVVVVVVSNSTRSKLKAEMLLSTKERVMRVVCKVKVCVNTGNGMKDESFL